MTPGLPKYVVAAVSVLAAVSPMRARGATNPAIVGGQPVEACAWPSVVSLGGDCTATLVHPELVVYAAHCGSDFDEVWFGESIFEPARRVATVECFTYPNGAPGNGADIAACRLAVPQTDVPVAQLVTAADLERLVPGAPVVVVGFGADEHYVAGIKREVDTVFRGLTDDGELHIGGDGRDSCLGDSGGPAFLPLGGDGESVRLAGIVSHGGRCGDGGFYTDASRFTDWLEAVSGLDLDLDAGCGADDSGLACDGPPVDGGRAFSTWDRGCARTPDDHHPAGAGCRAARGDGPAAPPGSSLVVALAAAAFLARRRRRPPTAVRYSAGTLSSPPR